MENEIEKLQTDIYRAMSPEQKYRAMTALINSARKLKRAYIVSKHPEWTDEQIDEALRDWFLYART